MAQDGKVNDSDSIKIVVAKGVTVKKVTYKSKNEKVATVTSKGYVTARGKGSTSIVVKVKWKRGKKKKVSTSKLNYKVTVKEVGTPNNNAAIKKNAADEAALKELIKEQKANGGY